MSPRPLHVALLVVLVALAGCGTSSAPVATDTQSPATASTTTPTTSTPNAATPSETPGMPGVSDGRVVEPMSLATAHATTLRDTSFAIRANHTVRYANGTRRSSRVTTGRFGEDVGRYAFDQSVSGALPMILGASEGRLSRWADGEHVYQRLTIQNDTSYQLLRDADGSLTEPRDMADAGQIRDDYLYSLLASFDVAVTGTADRNGTTLHRLASTDLAQPSLLASAVGADEIEGANLTAFVDSRGVVHELWLEYDGRIDGQAVRGRHVVQYGDIGSTTVEQPAWVDEAKNATSA